MAHFVTACCTQPSHMKLYKLALIVEIVVNLITRCLFILLHILNYNKDNYVTVMKGYHNDAQKTSGQQVRMWKYIQWRVFHLSNKILIKVLTLTCFSRILFKKYSLFIQIPHALSKLHTSIFYCIFKVERRTEIQKANLLHELK
jgi:hypothetical protein